MPYTSTYESAILVALQQHTLSASHTTEHLTSVLAFAKQLGATHHADIDILTAAVLLHDLGRSNTQLHGQASAEASTQAAEPLLQALDFPPHKIPLVLQNIADHDQPTLRPRHLEGRILKDADFLGGFGATGVMRSALWTGESGGSIADFVERIDTKMATRIQSLEFPESRQYAQERYVFVRLFLDKLRHDPCLLPDHPTDYIVLEGISGSGKTTQTRLLAEHLTRIGKPVELLHEPTPFHGQLRALIKPGDDAAAQVLCFLVDRYLNIQPQIVAARSAGKQVVSDRSFISTLVLQARSGWLSPANLAYVHTLVAQPTHIIVLDLPAEEAHRRILARHHRDNTPIGQHESLEHLRRDRQRFRDIATMYPGVHIIAADPEDSVTLHQTIRRKLHI